MAGRSGGRRRTMNEINMVPFIDVMLVLLIIFMATAPMITTGLIDVPTVGKGSQRPASVIEVQIGIDEKLKLKRDGQTEATSITLAQLAQRVKSEQGDRTDMPVVIAADRNVKYDSVVKVMDALQRNGVQRVGLVVKQGP